MSFEPQVATKQSGNDLMPGAPQSEGEESKTQFTSKGTIPPPLLGQEPTKGKSASEVAFGADPAWSKSQADALRAARDRVHGQQLALIVDDRCTTWALGMAKEKMAAYAAQWDLAKPAFEGGVQKHLDAAAKKRETANFMMGVALGALPQTKALEVFNKIMEVKGQMEGALSALDLEKSRFGTGQKRHALAPAQAAAPSGPATAKAPEGSQVKWVPLVDQLLDSKKAFNTNIEGVTRLDHEYDSLIDKFTAGEIEPDSELAKRAEQLAALQLPEPSGSFFAASDFLNDVDGALSSKDSTQIQREMAMQWIAELKKDQVNALGEVNPYLMQIGVTGMSSQKGLNFDGGDHLNNDEEMKLWTKARVQIEMQGLTDTHVEWLGGRRVGNNIQGTVRAANGNVYAATAKAGDDSKCYVDGAVVTERPGGSVRVQRSQHMNAGAMPEMTEGHFLGAINEERYQRQLRLGQFELVVAADGGNWETNADVATRGAAAQ